jgi:hypothetical protein
VADNVSDGGDAGNPTGSGELSVGGDGNGSSLVNDALRIGLPWGENGTEAAANECGTGNDPEVKGDLSGDAFNT